MSRFIGNVSLEEYQLEGALARMERLQQLQTRIQKAPSRAYAIFNSPATRIGLEEVGVDYEKLALESISIGMGAAIAAAIAAVIAIIIKVGNLIFGGGSGGGGSGGGGGGGGVSTPTQVKAIVKAVPVKSLPKVTKVVAEETNQIVKMVEQALPKHDFNFKESHPFDENDPMIWVKLVGSASLNLAKPGEDGIKAVALSYFAFNYCLVDRRRGTIVWTMHALGECGRCGLAEAQLECTRAMVRAEPIFKEYIATADKYVDGDVTVDAMNALNDKVNDAITEVRERATTLKDKQKAVIDYAESNSSSLKEISMHSLMGGLEQTSKQMAAISADLADSEDTVDILAGSNKTLEALKESVENSQLQNKQQIVSILGRISSVIGMAISVQQEIVAEITKWQADAGNEMPKILIALYESAQRAHGIDEKNEAKRLAGIAEHKEEYEAVIAKIDEIKAAKSKELDEFKESMKDNGLAYKLLGIKRT